MDKITEVMENIFKELVFVAKKQIKGDPSAEQIVVVKSTKDNTYFCVNCDIMKENYEDENQFLQMLADIGDIEAKYLVCMWKNGDVDIPSANLRKGILAICPKNEETIWLGQGEKGLIYKTVKDTLVS